MNQWHTEKLKLSILLFDEIEKASDALWQLLLGILDKATLTLGDNRRVDLSSCIIIMTSNLGASEMTGLVDGGLGFAPKAVQVDAALDDKIDRTAVEAARRKFTPEFMNRIDKIGGVQDAASGAPRADPGNRIGDGTAARADGRRRPPVRVQLHAQGERTSCSWKAPIPSTARGT